MQMGTTRGPTIDAMDVVPVPSVKATSSLERTETFTVKLGSWTYPLAWVGIYALHVACAVYCFAAAVLFQTLKTTLTAYYLDFYCVTLPSKHSPTIALVHYIIGGIHCWFLVLGAVRFLTRVVPRLLTYCRRGGAVVEPTSHRTTSTFLHRVTSIVPQTLERRIPWQLRKPVLAVYTHVFGRHGVLGVEYQYFDAFFLLREVVETALQSLQAYQMCRLLGRPALNRFYVATLIVNCWATPVLHHLVASKPLQRLLTRLCDVVLDFVASVGVPVILTLSYVDSYDPVAKDFPYELWYDDKWFVTALKESPLILFSSWVDALSRLVFSIGLLTSLDDVKLLLKRGPGVTFQAAAAKLRRMSTSAAKLRASRPVNRPRWRLNNDRSRMVTIAHRLMFAYGFVVLGVHLHAELRPSATPSCLLQVRPWLVAKPACSLVELNCWRDRSLMGHAADFDAHVGDLDALSLTQITFRHCQQVELQPSVALFQNLIGIKFYNSTIVTWDDDAALREQYHAAMRFVFFVRTTFVNATLPAGMLSHEFPLLLNDLELSVTNLRYIPDDLDTRWPPRIALCLEFSELTEFPSAFVRARLDSITLMGNKIAQLSAEVFEAPGLRYIAFTGNPITALPADVNVSRVSLQRFSIDSTNVTHVPPWVGEWLLRLAKRKVIAGRTPWCEQVVLPSTPSELETSPWLARINCKDNGPTYGVYPPFVDARADEIW